MKIYTPPTLSNFDEKTVKELFIETYVKNDNASVLIKFKGIKVTFTTEDFNHAVYEPDNQGNRKGKFSKRRASRVLWIKEFLKDRLPYKLLFEPENGNYCLFSEDFEYVIFLWPNREKKTLRFRSAWAFGKKVEHAMKKYKEGDKFIEVDKVSFEDNKGR